MSDSNRRIRPPAWVIGAASVIALVTAALLVAFFLWKLDYNQYRDSETQAEYPAPQGICFKLPPIFSFCSSDDSETVRVAEHDRHDLKSQQEMADWASIVAAVSIVSLGLSFAGVFLVYATWQKTAEAVAAADRTADDSKRIGEAQVRAYVYCVKATYKVTKDEVSATITLANSGQSPAKNVTIKGIATVYLVGGGSNLPRVLSYRKSKVGSVRFEPIRVGGAVEDTLYFFPPYGSFHDEISDEVFDPTVSGNEVEFEIEISWIDVFNQPNHIHVELRGIYAPSPSAPRKARRSATGILQIRGDDGKVWYPEDVQQ